MRCLIAINLAVGLVVFNKSDAGKSEEEHGPKLYKDILFEITVNKNQGENKGLRTF